MTTLRSIHPFNARSIAADVGAVGVVLAVRLAPGARVVSRRVHGGVQGARGARESREETSREEEDADAACVLRLDVVDDVRGRATVECELGLEGARKLDDALREASARVEALARVSGEDARA